MPTLHVQVLIATSYDIEIEVTDEEYNEITSTLNGHNAYVVAARVMRNRPDRCKIDKGETDKLHEGDIIDAGLADD
jgi:hypothetical protein